MFKRSNTAWGIDLGHQSLKAVKIVVHGGTARIEALEKFPYEGVEPDPDSVERSRYIRTALGEFMERAKPKKSELIGVAMPGRSAFNRTIPLPPVEEKRIPDIVKYEAQQLIPFPIDEVIWDYQRLSEGGMEEELEVTLFAVKTQIIYSYLASLKAARVQADIIQVAPLSLYNFMQYDQQPEGSTIVVDVGAGNADLVLIDGDRFWNRPLPYSGDDITKALQEKFQISFEEAEDLKRNSSTSKQSDKLFNVMRPVLGDMVSEIHRSIGYYKSQTRNVKFDRMALMGNSFKLNGMTDFFSQHLDYSVGLLDSFERLELGPSADAGDPSELSSYAVAIGLALQTLGLGPIKINMLPKEERIQKIVAKKRPYGAAAAAVLAAMVGASYVSSSGQVRQLKDAIQKAPPVIKRVKDDQTTYRNTLAQAGTSQMRINQIVGIGHGRSYWPIVLNQLQKAIHREGLQVVSFQAGKGAESSGSGRSDNFQSGNFGGGAGPANTGGGASPSGGDGVPMKLVVDVEKPEDVPPFKVIEAVTLAGGIEFELNAIPIFKEVKRQNLETVKVKVGLLRQEEAKKPKKEEDSEAKPEPDPDAGAAEDPGRNKPASGRSVGRGRSGAGRAAPAPGPRPASAGRSSDKDEKKGTKVIHEETLSFFRFTFTWSVAPIDDLHGSEEWWRIVADLAKDQAEQGKYVDAMNTLYNFNATSDVGTTETVKADVIAELKKLEPKLKAMESAVPENERKKPSAGDRCREMLDRLAPGWQSEAHASATG